jgi:flagellar operon protein (TIGR03826 family)
LQLYAIISYIAYLEKRELSMSQLEVANCPNCGSIFRIGQRELCNYCYQESLQDLQKCADFVKKNKNATMKALSEAIGVSPSKISKFIRDGRMPIGELPEMSYACELCSGPTRSGNLCRNCMNKINDDIKKLHENEALSKGLSQVDKGMNYRNKRQ